MGDVNWYYAVNGQRQGPVAFQQLQQLAATGHLAAVDLVWCEGMADWQAAGMVGGIMPPPQAPPPPQGPPPGVQYYGAYPQAPVQYQSPQYAGQSYNGMAIAGFVLSFVFALLGLIFSLIALNGMKQSGNNEGKGLATAGLIISIVFMSIGCLYFIGLASCFGAA